MMDSVLARRGSRVDFWGYLRSMQNAVERAASSKLPSRQMEELDREKLRELAALFEESITQESDEEPSSIDALIEHEDSAPSYLPGFSVKDKIKEVAEFEEWLSAAKLGTDKKIQRLIDSIHNYLDVHNLSMPASVPEFDILNAVLDNLLLYVQSDANA